MNRKDCDHYNFVIQDDIKNYGDSLKFTLHCNECGAEKYIEFYPDWNSEWTHHVRASVVKNF